MKKETLTQAMRKTLDLIIDYIDFADYAFCKQIVKALESAKAKLESKSVKEKEK